MTKFLFHPRKSCFSPKTLTREGLERVLSLDDMVKHPDIRAMLEYNLFSIELVVKLSWEINYCKYDG